MVSCFCYRHHQPSNRIQKKSRTIKNRRTYQTTESIEKITTIMVATVAAAVAETRNHFGNRLKRKWKTTQKCTIPIQPAPNTAVYAVFKPITTTAIAQRKKTSIGKQELRSTTDAPVAARNTCTNGISE